MAFPTTSALDSFNRADVGPPPSASWTSAIGLSQSAGLKVVSNQCAENGSDGSGYWNASTFGPDCEVYATIGVVSSVSAYLYARVANPGFGLGTLDGYLFFWSSGGNAFTYRIDDDVLTQLGTEVPLTLAANDKIGLEIVGNTLTLYANTTGSWASIDTHVDSTYPSAGYIGLGTTDTATRFDDFGGGTVVVPTNPPNYLGGYTNPRRMVGTPRLKFLQGTIGVGRGTLQTTFAGNTAGAGTTYAPTGAGIVGLVGAGADVLTDVNTGFATVGLIGSGPDELTDVNTGRGIVGLVGAGADAFTDVNTGYATVGLVGSGADAFTDVNTGAGIVGLVGSGADVFTQVKFGHGVVGLIGAGADVFTDVNTGAGIVGLVGSGADVYTGVDTGAGIAGLIGSGADVFTDVNTGFGLVGLVGSGADVFTQVKSGYGLVGLIGAGADALTDVNTGRGVVGLVGSGADVYTAVDTGAGIVGLVGSGADVFTDVNTGYGLVGLVGSGVNGSVITRTFTKAGYATVGLIGSGADVFVDVNSGAGVVGLVGSGADSFTDVNTGFGLVGLVGSGVSQYISSAGITYTKAGHGVVGLVGSGFTPSRGRSKYKQPYTGEPVDVSYGVLPERVFRDQGFGRIVVNGYATESYRRPAILTGWGYDAYARETVKTGGLVINGYAVEAFYPVSHHDRQTGALAAIGGTGLDAYDDGALIRSRNRKEEMLVLMGLD